MTQTLKLDKFLIKLLANICIQAPWKEKPKIQQYFFARYIENFP